MKFNDLYKLIAEDTEILEEGFKEKLKWYALASFLGLLTTGIPFKDLSKKISDELRRNPEKAQQAITYSNEMANDLSRAMPLDLKYKVAESDPDTSMKILQDVAKGKVDSKEQEEKKQVVPVNPQKAIDVLKKVQDYIRFNEISNLGIRNSSYKDSKGYQTIGIGHLVLDSEIGPGKLFTPDEISYKIIKGEKRKVITISDQKAEEIFRNDLNSKIKSASSKYNFPSLNKYPEKLQIAIIDGFFRGDLSSRKKAGQSKAREHIRNAMSAFFRYEKAVESNNTTDAQRLLSSAKNYLRLAAQNYLKHPDYRDLKKDGVDKRMKENAKLIMSALDDYSTSGPETTPHL